MYMFTAGNDFKLRYFPVVDVVEVGDEKVILRFRLAYKSVSLHPGDRGDIHEIVERRFW